MDTLRLHRIHASAEEAMSEPLTKEERKEWAEVCAGRGGVWGLASGGCSADLVQAFAAFGRALSDLAAAEAERDAALAHCRDPQWDATDAACIAWWRGDDHGCAVTLKIVERALDGKDEWTGRGGQWGVLKRIGDLLTERDLAKAQPQTQHDAYEAERDRLCGMCADAEAWAMAEEEVGR